MDKKEPPERIRKGGMAPAVASAMQPSAWNRPAGRSENEGRNRLAVCTPQREGAHRTPTAWCIVCAPLKLTQVEARLLSPLAHLGQKYSRNAFLAFRLLIVTYPGVRHF